MPFIHLPTVRSFLWSKWSTLFRKVKFLKIYCYNKWSLFLQSFWQVRTLYIPTPSLEDHRKNIFVKDSTNSSKMVEGGMKCVKILLLVFNFIFVVSLSSLILLTVWDNSALNILCLLHKLVKILRNMHTCTFYCSKLKKTMYVRLSVFWNNAMWIDKFHWIASLQANRSHEMKLSG